MQRTLVAVFSALIVGHRNARDPHGGCSRRPGRRRGLREKCRGGEIFLNAKEKRTSVLHNEARRDRNLKPFCVHPALQKAPRAHSKDMIERDYFSHDTKGRNEDAGERMRRYGYRWSAWGRT